MAGLSSRHFGMAIYHFYHFSLSLSLHEPATPCKCGASEFPPGKSAVRVSSPTQGVPLWKEQEFLSLANCDGPTDSNIFYNACHVRIRARRVPELPCIASRVTVRHFSIMSQI